MKTTGIIAEYNPFHKGHAYQLQKAKELTGADYMVIVMSGPFTQRGLPALVDKYTRTKMALENGADLVLELPVPYASGSAEAFAQGAVALLDSLGCIDTLCFGSESGDLKALISYAKLFEEEPEDYKSLLKYHLKQGLPFPAARSRAAEECLHYTDHVCVCSREDADCRQESELLYHPNNILGIEYCRALLSRRSKIRPVTLRRVSSGYHDTAMDTEFASASAIREAILREGLSKSVEAQLPNASFQILKEALKACPPVQVDAFSSILLYRLLTLSREDLASFQDVCPDRESPVPIHLLFFLCRSLKNKGADPQPHHPCPLPHPPGSSPGRSGCFKGRPLARLPKALGLSKKRRPSFSRHQGKKRLTASCKSGRRLLFAFSCSIYAF